MMIPFPKKMQSVLSPKHLTLDTKLQWTLKNLEMTLFLSILMDCMEITNGPAKIYFQTSQRLTLNIVR